MEYENFAKVRQNYEGPMRDIVVRYRSLAKKVNDWPWRIILPEAANEIEKLRNERDEARRELCELKSNEKILIADPREIAEMLGWDCYENKSHDEHL